MTGSLDDRRTAAECAGWVFFDRDLVDAAAALQHHTREPVLEPLGRAYRYHRQVFLAPPWPALFANDRERRHTLDDAVAEYERLVRAYALLDDEALLLPQVSVSERADWVLATIGER